MMYNTPVKPSMQVYEAMMNVSLTVWIGNRHTYSRFSDRRDTRATPSISVEILSTTAFSFLFLISSQFLLEFCLLSLSRSNCVYCSFYHCIVSIYSAVKLLVCFNKLTVTVTVTARFNRLLRQPACKRSGIIMVEWEGME